MFKWFRTKFDFNYLKSEAKLEMERWIVIMPLFVSDLKQDIKNGVELLNFAIFDNPFVTR